MYPLYNLALFLASPLLLPYYGWRLWRRGRSWEGLGERFGALPDLPPPPGGRPRVWVHAVSVGEVLAARPLLEGLRGRRPEASFVLSTVTETGRQIGRERVAGLEALVYLPLDYPWAVRRAVERLKPSLFVGLETELWPNLFRALHRRGVPVLVVNGRLSGRSFRGYRALGPLLRRVLACASALGVQSEEDAARYLALGAPPGRVRVTGNLKFDGAPSRWPPDREGARARFGLGGREPVVVAGSTHRGEEEAILDGFLRLSALFPRLGLLLAPRHLERLGEVEALARERGLPWRRRSDSPQGGCGLVILDTLGELSSAYEAADVAFIGGSLIPHGGQNLLEPAGWGVPVLFGPHMENFREAAEWVLQAGGALQVSGRAELLEALDSLLGDLPRARQMGERAAAVVRAHRGSLERTLALVEAWLGPEPPAGRTP